MFALAAVLFVPQISALAARAGLVIDATDAQRRDPTLLISRGKAETIDLDGPVADVMIADPSVLEVSVLKSNRLYIVGREIGDTNLIALDAYGNIVKRLNVHVRMDAQTLQEAMETLFPQEDVSVKSIGNQLILTGTVSNALTANKINDLAARFFVDDSDADFVNMMDVRGEQQVTLRVKIVEMSRTLIKELGIQTSLNDPVDSATSNPIFDLVQPEDINLGTELTGQMISNGSISGTPAIASRLFRDTGVSGLGTIEVLLRALEEENMLNTLAEPNLTAVSGEQASFLAGGEFPVPSGVDDSGNTVFTYRPFGVALNFSPVVMSSDRISLQLNTEVSQRNEADDAQVGSTELPAFDVSRASTTVEMGSGSSLMIAGLIDSQTVDGVSGVPGILDIPIFGDLVKSKQFRRNESEVLVIVTAYLVEPFADQSYAEKEPEHKNYPLADAFAATIRRTYGDVADELLNEDAMYGYLLE
ncbi:MAG: type II and III secretion system protein family protein [Alphaproteobacteria bacterium]|jgi:pilus assembly protein CpaC|nr:type II and III secretion system protein family protein [Alphaproteobacteria bacterium]MDP7223073.1 type II and III secretion system protein family protein [Alphaproteobacteria bacterium]